MKHKDIIRTQTYYERRNSKNKIVNQQIFQFSDFSIDLDAALTAQYNMIFGCDTNYIVYDSKKVCVACLSVLGKVKEEHKCFPIVALIFTLSDAEATNPERLVWNYFAKFVCSGKQFPENRKIAFVVDSDLGELQLINEQKIPMFLNNYKPDNLTFFYASADVGKENIVNKLIASADKASAEIIRSISADDIGDIPGFENALIWTKQIQL